MSTIVKTCEEFSSRRKVRYGYGSGNDTPVSLTSNLKDKALYTLTPSSVNASLTPHKVSYGKDVDGNDSYIIEFNVGEFRFDEISIRTEGRRLIVQGKSEFQGNSDEVCKEFTRDFTLPNDVDPYSIKAQLDESTRQLSLIGQIKGREVITSAPASSYTPQENVKIGTTREHRNNNNHIEYEIYLGNDLKDGQVKIDLIQNSLNIMITKKNWDKYGDFSLELNRQIRLPLNLNLQRLEHTIDYRSANLIVKIPFNS